MCREIRGGWWGGALSEMVDFFNRNVYRQMDANLFRFKLLKTDAGKSHISGLCRWHNKLK